jgi:hypothetical protein
MVSSVPEAVRAAEAGADVIVTQGTEGGGHVGWMGSMALIPMVVRAVAPTPVLAAGGVADGAGLAAALALGAEGVLLGTRFLATPESPVPDGFKRTLLESDGHDTLLTEIPGRCATASSRSSQRLANDSLEFGDTFRVLQVNLHVHMGYRRSVHLLWVSTAQESNGRTDECDEQDA